MVLAKVVIALVVRKMAPQIHPSPNSWNLCFAAPRKSPIVILTWFKISPPRKHYPKSVINSNYLITQLPKAKIPVGEIKILGKILKGRSRIGDAHMKTLTYSWGSNEHLRVPSLIWIFSARRNWKWGK